MKIGEVARQAGVSTDTVRFYERSGWLPRASRADNRYREYGASDVAQLRLLIDLRRLDVPLDDAARIAGWCHSGHCAEATADLPKLVSERRAEIAERIARLRSLDTRLSGLGKHLSRSPRALAMFEVDGACCDTARAIVGTTDRGHSRGRSLDALREDRPGD
ncbi:MAG: MerR family transcriptional regulator [Candidatus Limnocylindrales bacterium]